ncbi:hypothetical protein DFH09DRAFT_1329542 [Mycena vulgaris]|nr:hypothetical protein DFH09DRAFT_1329542 [Mycena vulgaris]
MAEYYDYYDDYDDHCHYSNTSTSPEPFYHDSEDFHYDHWHHPHPADHYVYTDDPRLGDDYADDSYDPYAYAAEVYADGSGGYDDVDVDDVDNVAEYDEQRIPYGADHDTYTSEHAMYEDDGTITIEYGQPGYWEEYYRRRDEIIYGPLAMPHLPDDYYSHDGLSESAEEKRVRGEEAAWEVEDELQYVEACTVLAEELEGFEPDTELAEEMREIEAEERRIAAEGYFWDEETAACNSRGPASFTIIHCATVFAWRGQTLDQNRRPPGAHSEETILAPLAVGIIGAGLAMSGFILEQLQSYSRRTDARTRSTSPASSVGSCMIDLQINSHAVCAFRICIYLLKQV